MSKKSDQQRNVRGALITFISATLVLLCTLYVIKPISEQQKRTHASVNAFTLNDMGDGEEGDVLVLFLLITSAPVAVFSGSMLLIFLLMWAWQKRKKLIRLLALVALVFLPGTGLAQTFWTDPNQYMRQQERWYDKHEDSCGICGQRLVWYTEASKPGLFYGDNMPFGIGADRFGAPEVPDSCQPKDLLRQYGVSLNFRVCEYCRVKYENHYADEIMKTKAGLIADYQHAEKKRRQQLAKALIIQRKKEAEARISVLEKKIDNLKAGKPEDWVKPAEVTADSIRSYIWATTPGHVLIFRSQGDSLRRWVDTADVSPDVPDNTVPVPQR